MGISPSSPFSRFLSSFEPPRLTESDRAKSKHTAFALGVIQKAFSALDRASLADKSILPFPYTRFTAIKNAVNKDISNDAAPSIQKLAFIGVAITNFQDLLQLEAYFMGFFHKPIQQAYVLLKNPLFSELWDHFPHLFLSINYSEDDKGNGLFSIPFPPIVSYFSNLEREMGGGLISPDFCALIHILFASRSIQGECLIISSAVSIPVQARRYICHENQAVRLMAKLLYFCESELIENGKNMMGIQIALSLFPQFRDKIEQISKHSKKQPDFVPLSVSLFKVLESSSSVETNPFLSEATAHDIAKIAVATNWLEEAVSCYASLLKIKRFCDFYINASTRYATEYTRSCNALGSPILLDPKQDPDYPLSKIKPFCGSEEEFIRVAQLGMFFRPIGRPPTSSLDARTPAHRHPPHARAGAGGPGAFVSDALEATGPVPEEPHFPEERETSSFPLIEKKLRNSIKETREALSEYESDSSSRGLAWSPYTRPFISHYKTCGRNLNPEGSKTLDHLPEILQLLAFNPLFSIEETLTMGDGREVDAYKSCLSIDGEFYILDCLITGERTLFFSCVHKPMFDFRDFCLTGKTLSLSLKHEKIADKTDHSSFISMGISGDISFDSQCNAVVNSGGHEYKVFLQIDASLLAQKLVIKPF